MPQSHIHYLDLERPSDIAKLADPELYLGKFADHLVILDEIQRLPDLFPVLRSLVDERRAVLLALNASAPFPRALLAANSKFSAPVIVVAPVCCCYFRRE
jgi:predicted AAA+ superfamily ATPase